MPRRGAFSWIDPRIATPVVALLWVLALVVVAPQPAQAENPLEVAEELSVDGVYVASAHRDLDEAGMQQAVARARAIGLRLVAIAPNSPEPDASGFARRVAEAANADATVIFTREGQIDAYVIEDFEAAQFRALAAARARSDPEAALDAFTEELVSERGATVPEIVRQLVVIMLILAVVLAIVVVIENQLSARRRRARRAKASAR